MSANDRSRLKFPLKLDRVAGTTATTQRAVLRPQRDVAAAHADARRRDPPSGLGLDSADVRRRMAQRLGEGGILEPRVLVDGRRLSRTDARRSADHGDAEARGNPFPQDAGARSRPALRCVGRPVRRRPNSNGETAFKLYDTYGFPLDLTQDALRQKGIGVDTDAFSKAMERQKAEARANWAGSGDAATETIWFELKDADWRDRIPRLRHRARRRRRAGDRPRRQRLLTAPSGERSRSCVNQTPFYGESGGQMGDTGVIVFEGGRAIVTDTQKKGEGIFVHFARADRRHAQGR